ncbi:MAG: glycosyltransferase family 4 protein [Chloroflexota bacterium]|nr:glycosyltransferase family 4 protein [Chloroflexota bacterium]
MPATTATTPTQVRLVGFRYHPAIGGAEQHARRLLREIGDRLVMDVVTVVTANRSDWLRLLVSGVRDTDERYIVDGRSVRALGRWRPATRQRLGRLSGLYHVPHGPVPSIMGRILAEDLTPVVAGAQLVHNVFMGREAFSLGLMLAAQRTGIPFVFTPLRHERPFGWNSPAFRQLYRSADRLVALTVAESAWLVSQGAPPDRVRVIGIGPLSNPGASPSQARELLGDRKIVLFLGQLHDYKGYRQLLASSRLLADRHDVLFAFAGPDVRGHARAFLAQANNVRYLPSVDDGLRDSLLAACSVLCVPSSRESFGGALIDAWACGKPVIGGPAAATRELIEEGITGFVVPQEPAAIADRLRRVLDDDDLGRRMGEEGRARAEARFSWSSIAAAYLRLYGELGVRTHDR